MSSSFDPFDVRMQLLSHLKKLNASQQSIQKVVQFAIKYGARCGEDLWDCMIEECEKGTLNVRINVLFLLDSLCETSLYVGLPDAPYVDYVTRDLARIVELVVPETREGVLNLLSAKQILESWRTKRIIRPDLVDDVLHTLEKRKANTHASSSSSRKRAHYENFSHSETLRRMEEDRERQKRLRERIWILPIPHLLPSSNRQLSSAARHSLGSSSTDPSPESPFTPASPFTPKTPRDVVLGGKAEKADRDKGTETGVVESALDIEFEQVWETTSELNDDDLREMDEENTLCFAPRPVELDEPPSPEPTPASPPPLQSSFLPTPAPSESQSFQPDPRNRPRNSFPPPRNLSDPRDPRGPRLSSFPASSSHPSPSSQSRPIPQGPSGYQSPLPPPTLTPTQPSAHQFSAQPPFPSPTGQAYASYPHQPSSFAPQYPSGQPQPDLPPHLAGAGFPPPAPTLAYAATDRFATHGHPPSGPASSVQSSMHPPTAPRGPSSYHRASSGGGGFSGR